MIFGCGVGYAVLTLLLALVRPRMEALQGWLPFLILLTGLPHYGATLERVYSTAAARQRYGRYALAFGLLVWGAFVATVVSRRGGSWLVTLYLTWSPWHYAAQNFGLVMMFLRRAGADISARFRRMIQLSFVFSFLLVFVNIHRNAPFAVNDPLYAASAARDAVQFVRLGIPDGVAKALLVCLGLAYVGFTTVSLVGISRKTESGKGSPAIALLSSQSVWFVLPIVLGQTIPAWVSQAGPAALQFIWVAIAHSVQYLWISLHFARMAGRTEATRASMLRYFGLAVALGATLWVFPVLLANKTGLSRMPHESGLDMLVAAAVNLHHFLLDGVIWKLRDAPVRQALVDGRSEAAAPVQKSTNVAWARGVVVAAGLIAVACWLIAAWEQEVGRRRAVASGDLERVQMAAKRLAWVGRDGPRIHVAMGKLWQQRGDDEAAMIEYQRGIDLWPTLNAWVGVGKIREKRSQWSEAQSAYEAALVLEPNHASTLDDLAHVHAARGNIEEAVKIELRAIYAAPERPDLRRRYDALVMKLPVDTAGGDERVIEVYSGPKDTPR